MPAFPSGPIPNDRWPLLPILDFVADSSPVGLIDGRSACFCSSYLAQGDNWWPLEFVSHKIGQSSTRRSESQHTVYRQCRSRADWEVSYGGDSLVKPSEPREAPEVSTPCAVFLLFGCFWSLCALYNSSNLSCSRGHRTHFSIPALSKAFMEVRAWEKPEYGYFLSWHVPSST